MNPLRPRFSLIEMMVVIAIVLLLCTLAAGRLGRVPTAAGLKKTGRELELLFAQGTNLATIRSRPIELVFRPEEKRFAIDFGNAGSAEEEFLRQRYRSVVLPSDMEVEFTARAAADAGDPVRFRCFPDGTAAGPEMVLRFHTRRLRLKVSPLTGQLLHRENRSAVR